MAQAVVEELGRIAMSPNLAASLARASGYAQAQLHREVWLEHLLLALTEDPDASQVLLASQVDIPRLNTDVSEVLGRIEDRNPPERADAISVSPDLKRILEAAGAAASKGRRREINGAIVLAAIVGDGRTAAAHLLRAQGLTFEEAIRVLRSSPQQPAAPAPALAPPPAPVQGFPPAPTPHQAQPPASQPEPAPRVRSSTEDILASARERVQRARQEAIAAQAAAVRAEPVPQPQRHQPPLQPELPPAPSLHPEAEPYAQTGYEPSAASMEPAAAETALGYPEAYYEAASPPEAEATTGMPPPLPAGVDSGPYPPFAAGPADVTAEHGWSGELGRHAEPQFHGPPPAQSEWVPPPAYPAPEADASQVPWSAPQQAQAPPTAYPAPRYDLPGIERATAPVAYPAPQPAAPHASSASGYHEPQLSPHPGYPPWPDPTPPQQPPLDYPPYEVAPAQVALPAPRSAPQPASRPQPRGSERRGAAPAVEAGQLVENIPRVMRKLVPVVVEARIAKADVTELMADMAGGGPAYRHEVTVTRAMSVKLRAPEGGFFIETASPETQWIENTLGLMSADFASWRWAVTPRETGKRRLQLVVAARTVGSDGLAAETAFPERVIDVAVKTNYALAARTWGGWVAAAILGGVLSKFGQSLLDASTKLATLLKAG